MRAAFSWKPGRRTNSPRPESMPLRAGQSQSRSKQWTLRGLHLQVAHTQGKLVRVIERQRVRRDGRFAPSSPSFGALVGGGAFRREPSHAVGASGPGARHPGDLAERGLPVQVHRLFTAPRTSARWPWDDPDARHSMAAARRGRARAIGQGCARQELRRDREVPMRVLVLGGGGQVGRAVAASGSARATRSSSGLARMWISPMSPRSAGRWPKPARIGWSMRAAYTAVDLAEDEPARATAVNDTAVGHAGAGGRARRQQAAASVDGFRVRRRGPAAPTCRAMPRGPLGVYGATKLAGEDRASAAVAPAIVLRTAWVYAAAGATSCSPCCG